VFTTEPVLAIPDIDREMRVEADASDYATGEVLSMKCEDRKWRPVAFISKSLNATEHNYDITNFIWSYLHQFFNYSHGLTTSLKPLKIPFDRYQSRLKAITNG